ncbi:MAG: stage III sporulation protein AF [Clostridia bacterium]
MNFLMQYVLSLCGAVVISTLAMIIIPEGRVSTICKSVISMFVFLVIVTPLINIKNQDFSSALDYTLHEDTINYDFLKKRKIEEDNVKIKSIIAEYSNKVQNITIKISYLETLNECNIKNIYIDFSSAVLHENISRNNVISDIKKRCSDVFDISLEEVMIIE